MERIPRPSELEQESSLEPEHEALVGIPSQDLVAEVQTIMHYGTDLGIALLRREEPDRRAPGIEVVIDTGMMRVPYLTAFQPCLQLIAFTRTLAHYAPERLHQTSELVKAHLIDRIGPECKRPYLSDPGISMVGGQSIFQKTVEGFHPAEPAIELCPAQECVDVIGTSFFEGRQRSLQLPRYLQEVGLHDEGLMVVRPPLEDSVQTTERFIVLTQEPKHVGPMS